MHFISLPLLILSGLTAYIISSWLLLFMRVIGLTRFSPRIYWACGLFGGTGGGAMFAGRAARALALSIVFPFLYALGFELLGNAELPLGAALGAGHGVLIGLTLPLLSRREGCRRAPKPGLFGWQLGRANVVLIPLVYAAYGAILGYVYVIASP